MLHFRDLTTTYKGLVGISKVSLDVNLSITHGTTMMTVHQSDGHSAVHQRTETAPSMLRRGSWTARSPR